MRNLVPVVLLLAIACLPTLCATGAEVQARIDGEIEAGKPLVACVGHNGLMNFRLPLPEAAASAYHACQKCGRTGARGLFAVN